MSRIAVAASATLRSVATLNSCGSQRWSMTSTLEPSWLSQIVRYGRPSTFTQFTPYSRIDHVLRAAHVDITVRQHTESGRPCA
jgi:hypothetical protein